MLKNPAQRSARRILARAGLIASHGDIRRGEPYYGPHGFSPTGAIKPHHRGPVHLARSRVRYATSAERAATGIPVGCWYPDPPTVEIIERSIDTTLPRRQLPPDPAGDLRLAAALAECRAADAAEWKGPREYATPGTVWSAYWRRVDAADLEYRRAYGELRGIPALVRVEAHDRLTGHPDAPGRWSRIAVYEEISGRPVWGYDSASLPTSWGRDLVGVSIGALPRVPDSGGFLPAPGGNRHWSLRRIDTPAARKEAGAEYARLAGDPQTADWAAAQPPGWWTL